MNKLKKCFAIIISLLTVFSIMPFESMAAISTTTNDYSDIEELDTKYSYGTVFISDETEFILTENNTSSRYKVDSNGNVYIGAKKDETIEVKITNSAIDEEGNMCDTIFRAGDIEVFSVSRKDDYLGEGFNQGAATSEDEFIRTQLTFSKYKDSDLLNTWLNTNTASTHFTLQYVKSGTKEPAKIQGCVSTIYDIDVYHSISGEIWQGCEGLTVDGADGDVYYSKGNWLTDTKDEKGVRAPMDTGSNPPPFSSTNDINELNSAVVVENFDNTATYKMFYSGYSCGIAYTFASPYPFNIGNPEKAVDKTKVYEEETFNYQIHQYIPNNYYAQQFNFISGIDQWDDIRITDSINSNLNIVNNVTVSNEMSEDVTSYFDISTDNNIVTAQLKSQYLSDVNFYAHLYTINIPVSFKSGSGDIIDCVKNTATTIIDDTSYESNQVSTELIYKITTEIINGSITPSEDSISHGSDRAITFTPNKGHYVSSIIVDGQTVDISPYKNGGTYNFDNIVANHNVSVVCTPYEYFNINIKYLDEDNNSLAEEYNQNIRAELPYNVTEEANKDIRYYTLKSIEGDITGVITGNVNIIVRYTRNQNSVTINYYEKGTATKLDESVVKTYNQGTDYDVNEIANKIIPYYTLETIEGNTTGILTEDIVINVYYTRNQNTLTINYLEKESGVKLADSVVQTYAQGSEYDVSTDTQKEIEHYTIDNISGEPEGVITEDIIIDVYYSHNIGKVIVNYIDTKGNELAESIIISGNVFDEYKTEPKEIDGYALYSTPENKEGTIQEETIVVTYIYDKQQKQVVFEPNNAPVKSPDTGADSYGPFKLIEFFSAIMLFFSGIILVAFFKPRNTDKKE